MEYVMSVLGVIFNDGTKQETSVKKVASRTSCYLLDSGFLLGLFFNPEDEGDTSLLNVC
jgi:hypothetical protein